MLSHRQFMEALALALMKKGQVLRHAAEQNTAANPAAVHGLCGGIIPLREVPGRAGRRTQLQCVMCRNARTSWACANPDCHKDRVFAVCDLRSGRTCAHNHGGGMRPVPRGQKRRGVPDNVPSPGKKTNMARSRASVASNSSR